MRRLRSTVMVFASFVAFHAIGKAQTQLASGVPHPFNIPAVSTLTLLGGASRFQISVPSNATRLEVRLTVPSSVQFAIGIRYGTDFSTTTFNSQYGGIGNESVVAVTPSSSPPLTSGSYYIGILIVTNPSAVSATITATVTTPPPPSSRTQLTSGVPHTFNIPSVSTLTLLGGASRFEILVPSNASRLEVRLTVPSSVQFAIGIRYGTDFSTTTFNSQYGGIGNESVVAVTPSSSPPLTSGTYYIGILIVTNPSPASATITATVTTGDPPPSVSNNGVVNNASFVPGTTPLTPGSVAAIFGTNLTDGTTATSSGFGTDGRLLTTLRGASVRFNGIAAPLFSASPGQLNVQVPWELAGATSASVDVTVGGQTSQARTVPLGPASPGIFTIPPGDQSTTAQGAIQIANTTLFAAPAGSIPGAQSRPASPGEFITIYCTGLGAVLNPPATGQPASGSPLSSTIATAQVTIGGIPATVSFSGLSPGFVGLCQVNAQVPAGTPAGNAIPVVLTVGGVGANTVNIAVAQAQPTACVSNCTITTSAGQFAVTRVEFQDRFPLGCIQTPGSSCIVGRILVVWLGFQGTGTPSLDAFFPATSGTFVRAEDGVSRARLGVITFAADPRAFGLAFSVGATSTRFQLFVPGNSPIDLSPFIP